MNTMKNLFLFPWLVAAIVAFLTTPLVIKYAQKLGIIDDPKQVEAVHAMVARVGYEGTTRQITIRFHAAAGFQSLWLF